MKTKHSPEPWAVIPQSRAGMSPIINDARGYPVATVDSDSDHDDADARLIAAAPEVARALFDVLRFAPAEDQRRARRALAKAGVR